jgi:glycosyltransferase involved in cell wall biosynthesis
MAELADKMLEAASIDAANSAAGEQNTLAGTDPRWRYCLSRASFWQPEHFVPSTWHEHAPFAFWLTDALRPRIFVELGTHYGFSYFAFCQAVQRLGLTTRCYAVDTWQGDDHAGFYGEEVFRGVNEFHERQYSGFSRLVRSTFDAAACHFGDSSVDLLHIDGRHAYDDVARDFATWLPKLSDRAVVLLHDINVRERQFGVWKFWCELQRRYPSFEFIHGHGLGVLQTGTAVTPAFRALFAGSASEQAEIAKIYARLGRAAAISHRLDQTRAESRECNRLLISERNATTTLKDEIEKSGAAIRELEAQRDTAIREHEARLEAVKAELVQRRAEADATAAECQVLRQQLAGAARTRYDLANRERQVQLLQADLDALRSSTFWRATAPLRRLLGRFPGAARRTRRVLSRVRRIARFDYARLRNKFAPSRQSGRAERQHPVSIAAQLEMEPLPADAGRETVLLVVHDASRSGAPILAYNIARRLSRERDVVALLLGNGELVEDFRACCTRVVGPVGTITPAPAEAEHLVQRLLRVYPIAYAIANSIASRAVLPPLAKAQIPVVVLVHEFSSYMQMREEMGPALEWATEIVFSSEITLAAAQQDYPALDNRPVHILRQGRAELPPREGKAVAGERQRIRDALRPPGGREAFVVLGCGTVELRKGVDLFLSCASAVARLRPRRPVRFVWVGSPIPGEMYRIYQGFLSEQLARAELEEMVAFVDEVSELDPAYELADLFFMCSRLDPLPNVAVEAALRGLPVVCFDKATGIAEVLATDPATRAGVLPHLDVAAAARLIADLADDRARYEQLSRATRLLAERAFDMDGYVRRLDELGQEAMAAIRQRDDDFATIRADPLFDFELSAGHDPAIRTRDEAIQHFLLSSAACDIGRTSGCPYRRPCPGFHPQIYERENGDRYERRRVNALAHFIRSGKPAGPWRHDVITPAESVGDEPAEGGLRVALHGHFHYPDLAGEFMHKLAANRSRCDLLLSTTSNEKAGVLQRAMQDYDRGRVVIRIAPNRGRDIGAFLTSFGQQALADYDIVGHVHGKRSLVLGDPTIGDSWREFLWQNLLGELHPMADLIIGRLCRDEQLGLVFPDDPHLSDWDSNRDIASGLAQRMGIAEPLPPFFDFPVGTMFWARTAALKPLLDLQLGWDDYPPEPVPYDGTALHAIERLLPFIARKAGYRYAATHIPGVTW